jgi:site-specific DNA-methyltransferase (cytosine-N4-specific)
MTRNNSTADRKLTPIFRTELGELYHGKTETLLRNGTLSHLTNRVQLIFTSPPFPLNDKKRYGNLQGGEYLAWFASLAPLFRTLLTPDGSIVIELGNAWDPGKPAQSLLPIKSLLEFIERGSFTLCQEITYYNPARLPSPAQWVTIKRVRLKDATTRFWWMSTSSNPKADNRKVLKPYSESMKRLLSRKTYNSGLRPSEHSISADGFLTDNGGSISPNLIEVSNTASASDYQAFCRKHEVTPHPARMPRELPEFFIKFLTDEHDIVFDPFGGSNTTGAAAEGLNRRWVTVEVNGCYAASSVSRFDPDRAKKLMRSHRQ